MDDALLRPGRLEVQIEIGLPKVHMSPDVALMLYWRSFTFQFPLKGLWREIGVAFLMCTYRFGPNKSRACFLNHA